MITTIIPTYRRPEILGRAIESVLGQSYGDFKVVVYDNASQDDTESVVMDYASRDARVFYFKNPVNLGPVRNMIQGVMAVETPYYSLLNDDDFLLPGFFERAVRGFSEHPEAMFSCSKTKVVNTANGSVELRNQDWQEGVYQPRLDLVKKMYSSHFVPTGVLFRREIRDALGPFETSGSDSLYLTMAAGAFPFVVLDHYGGAVTLHEHAYSMVGEGIAKESISVLYDHFLRTVSAATAASMPPEIKSLIVMLIVNSYHQIFDSKRLFHYLDGRQEVGIEQLAAFPSLITNRGLVSKFYNAAPAFSRSLLRRLYKAYSGRNRRRVVGEHVLPGRALEMLLSKPDDYSELFDLVAKG